MPSKARGSAAVALDPQVIQPPKARGSAAVALDPQVIQPQDEAKAGAQFPDGVQVVVTPDRPNKLERHGGLAKTGW